MEPRVDLLATLLLLLSTPDLLHSATAKKLPPGITACSRHEPEFKACALKNAKAAIPYVAKGVPSYGLLPLDPLHLERLSVDDTGSQRQVAIAITMKDVDILGLRRVQLTNIEMGHEARLVEWEGTVPVLTLLGKYDVKGRVLVLPIVGKGDMNITLENVRFKYTFRVALREGGTHASVSEPRLHFETTRCYLRFDNLFNGNKALSDNMNSFLNENWRELVKDLGPPIGDGIGAAFHQLVSTLVRQVPFADFYPDTPPLSGSPSVQQE